MDLYIPKWFYPNNLGDSIVSTFLPKAIKEEHPNEYLQVITSHYLIDVFKIDPLVDKVRLPTEEEIRVYPYTWMSYGKSSKDFSIYPEWDPKCFSTWNENFDFFSEHPTANILTLNFLLQNNLEHLMLDHELDLRPVIHWRKRKKDKFKIAVVKTKKIDQNASAHPGCDGKGYRYNGEQGESSWRYLEDGIKKEFPNVVIEEIPRFDSYLKLYEHISEFSLAITSDGGMHHFFNTVNIPVILLGAWRISKPEFLKLNNSIVYDDIFQECYPKCGGNLKELSSWKDVDKTCDGSCERTDSSRLLERVKDTIKELMDGMG